MQHLQNLTTTRLDPNIQSQRELYAFSERLSSGLKGLQGNSLLLLKIGIPLPSGKIVLAKALRRQMKVQLYLHIAPDKKYIRHVRPSTDVNETVDSPHSDAGGPVYRLWLSRLPIPHKHQIFDSLRL